jgi:hypothetical protein
MDTVMAAVQSFGDLTKHDEEGLSHLDELGDYVKTLSNASFEMGTLIADSLDIENFPDGENYKALMVFKEKMFEQEQLIVMNAGYSKRVINSPSLMEEYFNITSPRLKLLQSVNEQMWNPQLNKTEKQIKDFIQSCRINDPKQIISEVKHMLVDLCPLPTVDESHIYVSLRKISLKVRIHSLKKGAVSSHQDFERNLQKISLFLRNDPLLTNVVLKNLEKNILNGESTFQDANIEIQKTFKAHNITNFGLK